MVHQIPLLLLCLFVTFLYQCDASCEKAVDCGDSQGKRRAFIHIGPHKTGSTAIQVLLRAYARPYLYDRCFLYYEHHAEEYLSAGKGRTVKAFLEKARSTGMNVIYSAELLAALKPRDIIVLREDFKQFDTYVVMVYREEFTRLMSLYNHVCRNLQHVGNVTDFLVRSFQHNRNLPTTIARSYSQKFVNHTILIDYYGMEAAGKDIRQVVICEIMGLLCDETADLTDVKNRGRSNTGADWIAVQLVHLIIVFAYAEHGCVRFNNPLTSDVVAHVKIGLFKAQRTVPTRTIQLTSGINLAAGLEAKLRREFLGPFLYSNVTVNEMRRTKHDFDQIDSEKMWNDYYWWHWLRHKEMIFEHEGYLQKCNRSRSTFNTSSYEEAMVRAEQILPSYINP